MVNDCLDQLEQWHVEHFAVRELPSADLHLDLYFVNICFFLL